MTRNLKALGLALIAVFSMSAIVASAAQATLKVTPAESPAILTADSVGNQKFTINPKTAEPVNLECPTIGGSATVKTGDTSITQTGITYSGCSTKFGAQTLPATVHMEGCDFKFHGGNQDKEHHFINVLVDLVCPAGVTGPVITVFSDAKHEVRIGKYTCWNFVNQGTVTITNTTVVPDVFHLTATNVPVQCTRTEGILLPKPVEAATYNGQTTITAFKDVGGAESGPRIGVTMSE